MGVLKSIVALAMGIAMTLVAAPAAPHGAEADAATSVQTGRFDKPRPTPAKQQEIQRKSVPVRPALDAGTDEVPDPDTSTQERSESGTPSCPTGKTPPETWIGGVTWYLVPVPNGCALHLSGGTVSGDMSAPENFPWSTESRNIIQVSIDADFTIHNTGSRNTIFSSIRAPERITVITAGHLKLANSQSGLFSGVRLSSAPDMSHWDTSEVTDMSHMFENAKIPSLDVSNFDTSNVTNMSHMFKDADMKIPSLNVSNFDTSNVTNMSHMFESCHSLTSLDVTHFNTSNVTDMSSMFSMVGTATLDLSNFDTSNVTNMSHMFESCHSLTSLDVTHFNTSNVTDMSSMFSNCYSLTSLDVTHFNTSNVTDMSSMFSICYSLTSLDVTHFNTSNVTDMSSMFSTVGTATLDLSNFDTSNVTNMSYMFHYCSSLTSLDVTHFNTGNVTNMSYMFHYCSSLTSIDLTHFNTGNVTNIDHMFSDCSSLTSLDVTHFNTSNVTQMGQMFERCSSLTSIDLTHFNTTNVMYVTNMFYGCDKIRSLDLSSFDTRKANIPPVGNTAIGTAGILPSSLHILKLGPLSSLSTDSFWHLAGDKQWFRASSMDESFTIETPAIGDKQALANVTTGPNPEGIYRVPGYISLIVDWGNGRTDPAVEFPSGSSYTLPSMTGHSNPDGMIFSQWELEPAVAHTGAMNPGEAIVFAGSDDDQTVTLSTKWKKLQQPTITVNAVHTGRRLDPTVDIQAKVTGQAAGDRLHAWSQTGKATTKWDATYDYSVSDDESHQWSQVPVDQVSPAPGSQYELKVTLSHVDPATGNTVTTVPSFDEKSIDRGVLPYTTVMYGADGATSGTAPSQNDAYTDTTSLKAWITLPLLNADNGLARADGVLDGWSINPGAATPDTGMGDPDDRTAHVSATAATTDAQGHTTLTLYPVWRTGLTPDLNAAILTPNPDYTISINGHNPPAFRTDGARPDILRIGNDGEDWNPVTHDNGTWQATSHQPVFAGLHTITATVTAPDLWCEGRPDAVITASLVRKTPVTSHDTLPLTGGSPQRMLVLLVIALAAVLLLSTATTMLRNRRRTHASHKK